MRNSLVLAALLLAASSAQAQPPTLPDPAAVPPPPAPEPLWRKSGKTGLGLNESLLSSNWRGGGVNTIGFNALANLKANRKSGFHSFDNEADFLFAFPKPKAWATARAKTASSSTPSTAATSAPTGTCSCP